jgi:uncharacterized protein YhjY with autotransporter beta-barrel domain
MQADRTAVHPCQDRHYVDVVVAVVFPVKKKMGHFVARCPG